MTAPFRGSGPWRGRGPFLGRGPWAGKAPFGFNAGLPFQISVTGAQLRDALNDPTAWGTTGSATGWLLPGLGGARLSGDCRTSVAMQTAVDGSIGFAAHNLLTNSETLSAPVVSQTGVTYPGGMQLTMADSAYWYRQTGTISAGTTVTGALRISSSVTRKVCVRIANALTGANDAEVVVTAGPVPTEHSVTFVLSSSNAVELGVELRASIAPTVDTFGGTFTVDRVRVNLGSVALPYVPTGAAARYGPAIDWLSGIGQYGIRSEAARTNLVLYSADMGNAVWAVTGTGAAKVGAATALGAVPMHRINVGSVGGAIPSASAVYQSASVISGTQYTVSFIARSVSGTSPFRLSAGAGGAFTELGSTDQSGTTTPALFSFTWTSGATGTAYFAIRAATAGGVVGDIEVGGFQLEAGTEASSPILTYGAAATRAADTLVVLDSGWINQTEGTLVASFVKASNAVGGRIVTLHDTTGNNQIRWNGTVSVNVRPDWQIVTGGVSQANVIGAAEVVAGALCRVAGSYKLDDFRGAVNDVLGVADTSGTLPTLTTMMIGGNEVAGTLNGHLTRIRYSRRRASNGQLQALTV